MAQQYACDKVPRDPKSKKSKRWIPAHDEVIRVAEERIAAGYKTGPLVVSWSNCWRDLGLVCVGIIRATAGKTWEVDTFLMSCRVMGRHVEDAFLSYLAELARARGAQRFEGVFLPTAKNTPVISFYESRRFVLAGENRWVLDIQSEAALRWPAAIARKEQP